MLCIRLKDNVTEVILTAVSTCIEERVGVSTDDDVDPADLPGDLLIHGESGVTQCNDLIDSQRQKFVHMRLQGGNFILELQVWSCRKTETGEMAGNNVCKNLL